MFCAEEFDSVDSTLLFALRGLRPVAGGSTRAIWSREAALLEQHSGGKEARQKKTEAPSQKTVFLPMFLPSAWL
jgi:hypothetical protein